MKCWSFCSCSATSLSHTSAQALQKVLSCLKPAETGGLKQNGLKQGMTTLTLLLSLLHNGFSRPFRFPTYIKARGACHSALQNTFIVPQTMSLTHADMDDNDYEAGSEASFSAESPPLEFFESQNGLIEPADHSGGNRQMQLAPPSPHQNAWDYHMAQCCNSLTPTLQTKCKQICAAVQKAPKLCSRLEEQNAVEKSCRLIAKLVERHSVRVNMDDASLRNNKPSPVMVYGPTQCGKTSIGPVSNLVDDCLMHLQMDLDALADGYLMHCRVWGPNPRHLSLQVAVIVGYHLSSHVLIVVVAQKVSAQDYINKMTEYLTDRHGFPLIGCYNTPYNVRLATGQVSMLCCHSCQHAAISLLSLAHICSLKRLWCFDLP